MAEVSEFEQTIEKIGEEVLTKVESREEKKRKLLEIIPNSQIFFSWPIEKKELIENEEYGFLIINSENWQGFKTHRFPGSGNFASNRFIKIESKSNTFCFYMRTENPTTLKSDKKTTEKYGKEKFETLLNNCGYGENWYIVPTKYITQVENSDKKEKKHEKPKVVQAKKELDKFVKKEPEKKKDSIIKYEEIKETKEGTLALTIENIKNYLCKDASMEELGLFLHFCKVNNLDPFKNEAYIIKYSKDDPAKFVVSKDVFLKRADNHKEFDGLEVGIIYQKNDEIENRAGTLLLENESLIGAWCRVHRKDRKPFYDEVSLKEYQQFRRDGKPNKFWSEKPATMIRKVALARVLREAFPNEFSGFYDRAELPQEEEVQ